MEPETQLFAGIAYIVFMILLAWVFKTYPPKEINALYGYRTKRSMANPAVWKAANLYWTRLFYRWQWYLLATPVVFYFIWPHYGILGTILVHTLMLLLTIPATERFLNKHFDANGNPR
jgi:hypothetical protein